MFFCEVTSAINESQTVDEGVHLASGYAYFKKQNFELNPEHPPLIKYLAAFPLLFLNFDDKFDSNAYLNNSQWDYARDFIHNNWLPNNLILNLGRLPVMLLSLLLSLIIFKYTEKYICTKAAFFALILYSFDPNIIAHSRYVTNDIGIALFILLTVLLYLDYLKKPNWLNLFWFSLAFAGALLTKFSSVILIPILLVLYLIACLKKKRLSVRRLILSFFMTFLIAYLFIFILYGFEIKKPIADPLVSQYYEKLPEKLKEQSVDQTKFTSFWLKITNPENASGKLIHWFSDNIPVPGYSYFRGFYILARHNYFGHTSYLLGSHSNTGWWYYFPVVFLVKTPLSVIILLILSLVMIFLFFIKKNKRETLNLKSKSKIASLAIWLKNIPLHFYALGLVPLIYFLWTLTSQLNIGFRHILPIYSFLYILIAYFLTTLVKSHKKLLILSYSLFIYFLISSFLIYPNYLSYFHELVGGPRSGHLYLTDSNLDWGQGLIQLKKYMDEKNIGSIYLHYFGSVDPRSYGINWQSPPDNEKIKDNPGFRGLVAISVTALYSKEKEFSWLLTYQPIKKIGYSIWLYNIEK